MNTLSQIDIENGLKKLGLKSGIYIEVHSSLSSFGNVIGGAETIINSLKKIITKSGAIIMSTFLMSKKMKLSDLDKKRGLTCKIKILDSNSDERTGMGIVSDEFRKINDVKTGTGVFRVSAWGAEVDKNILGYTNLHEHDGYGLLLGVDIYSLSSMHYVEQNLPKKIKDIFKAPSYIQKYYPEDQWYIETGNPPEKAWYKIQSEALEKGYIKEIFIGNARCMFFKVNKVIDLYKKAINDDPLGLYGL